MALYKTIVLNLLEANTTLHEELRQNRTLLPTLNRLAEELREDHHALKEQLRRPGTSESQIASEALEIAVADLSSALRPENAPSSDEDQATQPA